MDEIEGRVSHGMPKRLKPDRHRPLPEGYAAERRRLADDLAGLLETLDRSQPEAERLAATAAPDLMILDLERRAGCKSRFPGQPAFLNKIR